MRDAAKQLRALVGVCAVAFLGFAVAGFLIPDDRAVLHASATAFLIGTALALAAGRGYAELTRRLAAIEGRLKALEGDKHASLIPRAGGGAAVP